MHEGMTLEKIKKDTTANTRHIRSIFAMDKFIKANSQNGLKYASKYYADDDHGSVPLISEYDGLRFIFSWYRFKFQIGDFTDPGTEVVTKDEATLPNSLKRIRFQSFSPGNADKRFGLQCTFAKTISKSGGII